MDPSLIQNNQLDTLPYYTAISPSLKKYLKNKPLATKVWLPNGIFFLKRGSKEEPLFIEELQEAVTPKMLALRPHKLDEVKKLLTKQQIKVWNYFPPRKLLEVFYATNGEGIKRPMERIFFDIDRKEVSVEKSLKVTQELLACMKNDSEFQRKYPGKIVLMWTGNSFHLTILLKKSLSPAQYAADISFQKKNPLSSFTGRWASAIAKSTSINLSGGHEKKKGSMTIDPSQTPSGKLARAPFSLHLKSPKETDGIAIPLDEAALSEPRLLKKLMAMTPSEAMKSLRRVSKNLIE